VPPGLLLEPGYLLVDLVEAGEELLLAVLELELRLLEG
jgi:hypothetical protein